MRLYQKQTARTLKCQPAVCTEWHVYALHAFSYYRGKQVVFFSHSRRLLKQSAFSVNLSISAATALTAAWRAEGGAKWGKYSINTRMHTMRALPGERGGWRLLYLFMSMSRALRGYRWEERQSGSAGTEPLMRRMEAVRRWGGALTAQLKRGFAVCLNARRWHSLEQLIPNVLDNTDSWPTQLLQSSYP